MGGGSGGAFFGGGSGGAFEVLRNIGIRRFLYYMAESVPAGWDPPQPTLSSERQGRNVKMAGVPKKRPKTGGTQFTKVSLWAPKEPLSLILPLF